MNTVVKKISDLLLNSEILGVQVLVKMRTTPLKDWLTDISLSDRLSGTVKKNSKVGFNVNLQLEHEALCQTLGWGFESIVSTRVNFNDAISEGDCHSLTEVGWHFDRMTQIQLFPEDYFELKYIVIQDEAGNIQRQGIGIIVRETSIQWIKKGKLVIAMLTEYDLAKKEWTDCINPF